MFTPPGSGAKCLQDQNDRQCVEPPLLERDLPDWSPQRFSRRTVSTLQFMKKDLRSAVPVITTTITAETFSIKIYTLTRPENGPSSATFPVRYNAQAVPDHRDMARYHLQAYTPFRSRRDRPLQVGRDRRASPGRASRTAISSGPSQHQRVSRKLFTLSLSVPARSPARRTRRLFGQAFRGEYLHSSEYRVPEASRWQTRMYCRGGKRAPSISLATSAPLRHELFW